MALHQVYAGCHPRVTITQLVGSEAFQNDPTDVLPVTNKDDASPVANGTWDPVGTFMFDLTYSTDKESRWDVHFSLVNPKDESQAPDTINVRAVMTDKYDSTSNITEQPLEQDMRKFRRWCPDQVNRTAPDDIYCESFDANLTIVYPQPSTLNPQPSTLNPQPKPCTLNLQPLTLTPDPAPGARGGRRGGQLHVRG